VPLIGADDASLLIGRPAIWQIDDFTAWQGIRATPDDLGCRWYVTEDEGWRSPTEPKAATVDNPVGDGQIVGEVTYGSRQVTLAGTVLAPDTDALFEAMDNFHALLTGDTRSGALTVTERGKSRSCRVVQGGQPIIKPTSPTTAEFSLSLLAGDPRKLGPILSSQPVLPASQSGGLTYPITYPLIYPAVTATGIVTINNPGKIRAPLWARIDGPCPVPMLTSVTAGSQLVFAASVNLGVGEFVTIDMENKQVLAQGTTTRAGYVISRGWFGLEPGDNQLGFTCADSANTQASVTWIYPDGAW
jgi:Phage tail protein